MTPQEELANYMAIGMKDYAQGVEIYKKLGCTNTEKAFLKLSSDKPSKVQFNILRQKLNNVAKARNIKPKRNQMKTSPVELDPNHQDIPQSEPADVDRAWKRFCDKLGIAVNLYLSKFQKQ